MRIVFLGSPDFAVPSLRALAGRCEISIPLVVTQPDRPAGRGRKRTPPAVKVAAEELGLPVFQPESLRDTAALDVVEASAPDLLVVVAYGELLNRRALHAAPHGALNVHPSLLPKHRGAAPIPAAILNGDTVTGVSIMRIVRRLDAGPVVAQRELEIAPHETTGELSTRLAQAAADLLPAACIDWIAGTLTATPQLDESATYTREWTRADARIDWGAAAVEIERLVRAANPWPVAWTRWNGDDFRIWSAAVATETTMESPGTVARRNRAIVVASMRGALDIQRVQPAGKQVMDALDWWNGLHRADVRFE